MKEFTVKVSRSTAFKSRVQIYCDGECIDRFTADIHAMGLKIGAHLRMAIDADSDVEERANDYRSYLKDTGKPDCALQPGAIRLKDEYGNVDIPLSSSHFRKLDKLVEKQRRIRNRIRRLEKRSKCTSAD